MAEHTPDPVAQELRRKRAVSLLVPLFIMSGATSLVYETLWERQLHLVVGTSQVSVITTLAAFMTGLAGGGFIASRVADRIKRPLVTYAVLEGAIGLYALLFPTLVQLLVPVYTGFWEAFHPSPTIFATFQFLLLGFFLLPPTICMGATLPVLARFSALANDESGKAVGGLYGANTMGAVVGVGLAGFVLLPGYGLAATTWITAGGNLLLCLMAGSLGLFVGDVAGAVGPAVEKKAEGRAPAWTYALPALALMAGLSSLIYEVSWFRVMVLTLGGSAYAFSVMLLSFLLGIGTGGWAGGFLADAAWRRGQVPAVLTALGGLQFMVALLAYGVMWQYNELPFWFVDLYNIVVDHPDYLWPAKLLLSVAIMAPPAFFMGATFPVLVRAASVGEALGAPVGRIYGWNTVGSILGATFGGLLLLPTLAVTQTVLIAVSLNVLAMGGALWAANDAREQKLTMPGQLGIIGLVMTLIGLVNWAKPPWDALLMTAGMYKYVSDMDPEDRNREGVLEFAVTPYELLYYKEGLSSVVTVARQRGGKNIWLANNGKVDASTQIDMPTQVLCAHLPFVYAPDAKDVLVIGLASGITAGSVSLHSSPTSIEIIELEPAIVEASHYFDEHNHRVLEDPRVKLIANDGRNHLFLQPDGRYDLIVSEPSNPWLTGVSNLFTAEFFAMSKRKLKKGGVWSQWVQLYGMDHEDLRSLFKTFATAYKYVHLYSTIEDADTVLIGSDEPLKLDADAVARIMGKDPKVAADFAVIEVTEPEDVLIRFLVDQDKILEFTQDAELNTDDNMRIEYGAPLHLHEDTADDNFARLLKAWDVRAYIAVDKVEGTEGMIALAEAYNRADQPLKAYLTIQRAIKEDPENVELTELLPAYAMRYRQILMREELEEAEEEGGDDAPSAQDAPVEVAPTGAPGLEGPAADGAAKPAGEGADPFGGAPAPQ